MMILESMVAVAVTPEFIQTVLCSGAAATRSLLGERTQQSGQHRFTLRGWESG